jgi:hypothetical protein
LRRKSAKITDRAHHIGGEDFFGLSPGLREKVAGYEFSDKERRVWYDQLKSKGKLANVPDYQSAHVLHHAEAQALIRVVSCECCAARISGRFRQAVYGNTPRFFQPRICVLCADN